MDILVADDHALVRQGLSSILRQLDMRASILEAEDGAAVMRLISGDQALDMVLLDLFMPGAHGFDLLQSVCDLRPEIPVIVLSASEDPGHMRQALDYGAAGYIPKSSSPAVILSALQLIRAGGIYVPPHMLNPAGQNRLGRTEALKPSDELDRAGLTERQLEVLSLLGEGKSNKEIARTLQLSENTVKIHVRDVLKALGVNNRTKAAMLARELGLQ
jgi:DNA-binding NarL/FixJ family response regulator